MATLSTADRGEIRRRSRGLGATISVQYRAVVAPEAPVVAPEEPGREVDLDWRSVLWVLIAFVGLLAVTALIRGAPRTIAVLAVGTLLALALDPLVTRAARLLRHNRGAGVVAVMLGLLLVVVAAGAVLIPRAIEQGRELGRDTDRVVNQI